MRNVRGLLIWLGSTVLAVQGQVFENEGDELVAIEHGAALPRPSDVWTGADPLAS